MAANDVAGAMNEFNSGKVRANAVDNELHNCISLLGMAMVYGTDSRIVKKLLDMGADPNYENMKSEFPLSFLFVNKCNLFNTTRIRSGQERGKDVIDLKNILQILEYMIAAGADIENLMTGTEFPISNYYRYSNMTLLDALTIFNDNLCLLVNNSINHKDLTKAVNAAVGIHNTSAATYAMPEQESKVRLAAITKFAKEAFDSNEQTLCKLVKLLLDQCAPDNIKVKAAAQYMLSQAVKYALPMLTETLLSCKFCAGLDNTVFIRDEEKTINTFAGNIDYSRDKYYHNIYNNGGGRTNNARPMRLYAYAAAPYWGIESYIKTNIEHALVGCYTNTSNGMYWLASEEKNLCNELVCIADIQRRKAIIDILVAHGVPLDIISPETLYERSKTIEDITNIYKWADKDHDVQRHLQSLKSYADNAYTRAMAVHAVNKMSSPDIIQGFDSEL